jgi:hypothetical protein
MSYDRREADRKYNSSEKGRARQERYNDSEKGRERRERWEVDVLPVGNCPVCEQESRLMDDGTVIRHGEIRTLSLNSNVSVIREACSGSRQLPTSARIGEFRSWSRVISRTNEERKRRERRIAETEEKIAELEETLRNWS